MSAKIFDNTALRPYSLTVYLEDTDAGGFVYHANYLKYFERARTELLRQNGVCHGQLITHHKKMFVVYAITITFFSPANLGDCLNVYTEVGSVRGARLLLKQSIVKNGHILVEASIELAYIDHSHPLKKPVRIPEFIISALAT